VDQQRVYALTSKGNAELMGASTSLDAPELKLLVLVDGRATVAQIAQSALFSESDAGVGALRAKGYFVRIADGRFRDRVLPRRAEED
jgi:hypothetical protein